MTKPLVALAGLVLLTAGLAAGYEWYTHGKWYAREPAKGTILLFHLHPVSNFNYLGRNNQPHITEGITAILAGVTYLLGEWGIMRQRWWKLVPAVLVVLMGVQLIVYLE